MKELRSLLSGECTPAVDLSGYDIDIYHGVRYLMEAGQAARILGVSGSIPSTAKVATPGFPRDGLSYIAYDGNFEKHYNRVYLVTDAGDKVVCIQFVDEHPTSGGGGANGDWNTYNFVNTRLRASAAIGVRNESRREGDIIHIDTHAHQRGREFENTKLLIPIPFARLILHCIDVGLAKP